MPLKLGGLGSRLKLVGENFGSVRRLLHGALIKQRADCLLPSVETHRAEPVRFGVSARERVLDVSLNLLEQYVLFLKVVRIFLDDQVRRFLRVFGDVIKGL